MVVSIQCTIKGASDWRRHLLLGAGRFLFRGRLAERWENLAQAFYRGLDLPPVRLHKMGDSYFVEDDNHRVSVAHYQEVEMIKAEVTEFFPLY